MVALASDDAINKGGGTTPPPVSSPTFRPAEPWLKLCGAVFFHSLSEHSRIIEHADNFIHYLYCYNNGLIEIKLA